MDTEIQSVDREVTAETATPADLKKVCEDAFEQQSEDSSAVTDAVRGLHFIQVSREDDEGRIALHQCDNGSYEVHFWDRNERPLSGVVKISPDGGLATQFLPIPHHKHPVERTLGPDRIFGVLTRIEQAAPVAA